GLPLGAASLVESAAHAAGWAMFADPRLGLAVARGSGPAVAQLGTVAREAGNPISLHGTGGAWMVADGSADAEVLAHAVLHSLDRKVCNTLNVAAIVRDRADELVPVVLASLRAAAERRGTNPKLHVAEGSESFVDAAWFAPTGISRAEGVVEEPGAEPIAIVDLGTEWEWEDSPELSLVVVDSTEDAIELFNAYSPHFVASLISDDASAHERFYELIDAPFVGNGFTRWVDGQYALGKPELGLSNWESGRLFGRGGVLSGDSVFAVRTRVTQRDPGVHR
ncbi:MAG: glutamate-5-semialdehyde dehydrogenase, partial [Actinobacteria bacterium]|nr:glutamate-5-semialdehyde dehydrogenase [Actinomycetota bacterium]